MWTSPNHSNSYIKFHLWILIKHFYSSSSASIQILTNLIMVLPFKGTEREYFSCTFSSLEWRQQLHVSKLCSHSKGKSRHNKGEQNDNLKTELKNCQQNNKPQINSIDVCQELFMVQTVFWKKTPNQNKEKPFLLCLSLYFRSYRQLVKNIYY